MHIVVANTIRVFRLNKRNNNRKNPIDFAVRCCGSITIQNGQWNNWSGRGITKNNGHSVWTPGSTTTTTETTTTTSLRRQHTSASTTKTFVHSSLPNGCIDYARGWAWQQALLLRRMDEKRRIRSEEKEEIRTNISKDNNNNKNMDATSDRVLLLEHHPVYTLGRGAKEENLAFLCDDKNNEAYNATIREKLSRIRRHHNGKEQDSARLSVDQQSSYFEKHDESRLQLTNIVDKLSQVARPVYAPNGAPIYRVERGGEVTYHGPGQLLVYPMFDLTRPGLKQDLHWFLRMVEEVVIKTLHHYGIEGCRDEINTGVWVDEKKICAVGVSASRWITTHGFALNVSPNLAYFDTSIIIPCGIEGRGVTSIAEVLNNHNNAVSPTMDEVATVATHCLEEVFGIQLTQGETIH